jgi:hypothetical protein
MGRVEGEVTEDFAYVAQVASLGSFVADQKKVQGEGFVVRIGVEPGFAKVPSLAALIDGDDALSFVVKASGLDEAMTSGMVKSGEVALEEVGKGCGEFVRVLLLVGLRAADELRRRRDALFRGGHDAFQFGMQSSVGSRRSGLNAGNLPGGPGGLSQTKDPAIRPGLREGCLLAYETMPRGLMVFQPPRVKSGHWIGMLPSFTERAEISRMLDQSAAS